MPELPDTSRRAQSEIKHGKALAQNNAESIWGWGSAAGKIRAQRRADWIMRAAGLKPGTRALEIGCGTGVFTEIFAQSGADILATDISEDLLAYARQRKLPTTVSFACSPFEKLSTEQPFEAIIGSSILHHLDIEPALAHIFQLLKPGGKMAFAEPNMLNPQIMIQSNIAWLRKRMGYSPDETAFFLWAIKRRMSRIGFIDIQVKPRDWLHPAIPPRWIHVVQKLETILENVPIAKEFSGSIYITGSHPE